MSDPKLISPLLDGFALGNPISSHDGVRCCPAIKENSDKKYIVKIITIPPSQAQIDALLLAGAYKDPSGAMEYYRVIGEEVMKEAELLTTLSKLDGFLPYEGWQMEPITKRRLGYEVYLVGSYKRSLEKYVRRNPVTHLEAVNLALDMCSALAVCRQSGALYVDLKPNNIFMSDKKEYRIGDLGFISLDALSYTTLPEKYHSKYTPPELLDPMAPMNLTVDTYAVGMILYQLYNDGQLPFQDKVPEEGLPSPMNADYELAEIIMKAIHTDPSQRWKDPQEMGRALVSYMQRNAVNDVPITPHTPLAAPAAPAASEPQPEAVLEAEVPETTPEVSEAAPEADAFAAAEAETEVPEEAPAQPEEIPAETPDTVEDETLPSEEDADSLLPHEMSDELSQILNKAEDLISHEIPEEFLVPEPPVQEDPFGFVAVNPEDEDDSDIPLDPLMEDTAAQPEKKKPAKSFVSDAGKKTVKQILALALIVLLLTGIALGASWGYQNYYLQTIDGLTISGDRGQLNVYVDTQIDESLLYITCADNYGNLQKASLVSGCAVFKDLLPGTMYKIQVEINGFHKLQGETSNVFTTDATTNILAFSAVTGAEDGSVMLNFTVDGDEPDMWTLVYRTEDEEAQRKNFDGHSVTVSGLSVGKLYTFTLEAGNDISLSGETSLNYMASRLILAQNMTVDSANGNDLSITWTAPGDIVVDSWNVRCYSSNSEEQLTVTDMEAYFTNIDPNISYTVEVTAQGMTQPARISITEDPVSITGFHLDDSKAGKLKMSWEHSGTAPVGGWLLMYTIDGGEANKSVIKCENASAELTNLVPDADYHFTIQAADSTTVFAANYSYSSAEAADFDANGLSMDEITGYLVKTPEEKDWVFDSVGTSGFANSFSVGDPISVVLHGNDDFYLPGSTTHILFVIRDGHDNVLSELVSTSEKSWRDMWYPGDDQYAELDIPKVPTNPGSYSVTVFFDNAKVATIPFTVS